MPESPRTASPRPHSPPAPLVPDDVVTSTPEDEAPVEEDPNEHWREEFPANEPPEEDDDDGVSSLVLKAFYIVLQAPLLATNFHRTVFSHDRS